MAEFQGENRSFTAGEMIFSQGSRGGDLYLIKSGHVRVCRSFHNKDVNLYRLGPGEILGIVSCMNEETRVTSAYADTDVELVFVKHSRVSKLIETIPKWTHAIFKDFSARLNDYEDRYCEAALENERLFMEACWPEKAAKVAEGLAVYAEFIRRVEKKDVIDVTEGLIAMIKTLNISKGKIVEIFETFVNVGLLSQTGESKSKLAEYSAIIALREYSQFCRSQLKAVLKDGNDFLLGEEACHLANELVHHAKVRQLALNEEVRINFADVESKFSGLEELASNKAVVLEKWPGKDLVRFVPSKLARRVRSQMAFSVFADWELENPL